MHRYKLLKQFSLSALTAALVACGGGGSSDGGDTSNTQSSAKMAVELNPQFTAYFDQVARDTPVETAGKSVAQKLTANQSYNGTLTATNLDTGETEQFDWYIKVDNEGNIVSQKNIALSPGTYTFSMLIEGDGYQYGGVAQNETLADGDIENISIIIKPIVGESIADITLLDTMADIQFAINSADLIAANIEDPRMGIIVNGENEQVFTIDKTTGLPSTLISLPDGQYTIEVNFYDGNKLIGHSLDTQESLSFIDGQDVQFDIIALQADISFVFGEGAEDASAFKINVPAKIVEQVTDLANLKAHLKFSGNEFVEQVLDIEQIGDSYIASTELSVDIENKDTLSVNLEFLDTSLVEEEQLITSCSGSINLQSSANSFACALDLENEYIAGGKLLGTLAINVLQKNGDSLSSVEGAEVFVNGESIGLTDGSVLSTPGYIKAHRQQGNYTIRVEAGDRASTKTISLDPLEIKNLDITLLSQSDVEGENGGTSGGGTSSGGTTGGVPNSQIGGGIVYVDGPGCGEAAPTNSNLQPSEFWVQIAAQTGENQMSTCVDQSTYSWLRDEDTKLMVAYPDLGLHYTFDLYQIKDPATMNCAYLPETLPSFETPNVFWKEAQCNDSGAMASFSLQTLAGQWCETVATQAPAQNIAGVNYGSRTSGSACNLYIQRFPDPYATLLPSTNSDLYADNNYTVSYSRTYDMLVDDSLVAIQATGNIYQFDRAIDEDVTTFAGLASPQRNSKGTFISMNFPTPITLKRFEIIHHRGLLYPTQTARIQARIPGNESVWTTLGAYTLPQNQNAMLQIPEHNYGPLSEYRVIFVRPFDTRNYINVGEIKAYTY